MAPGRVIEGQIAAKSQDAKGGDPPKPGPLVEDTSVTGGTDKKTGASVIRPKTVEGRADESTEPTDRRERTQHG